MVCCWAMSPAVLGIIIWRPELTTTCPAWLAAATGAGLYLGIAALSSS